MSQSHTRTVIANSNSHPLTITVNIARPTLQKDIKSQPIPLQPVIHKSYTKTSNTSPSSPSKGINFEGRIYKICEPRTASILFNAQKIKLLLTTYPHKKMKQRNKMSAKLWNDLNDQHRVEWLKKAENEKLKYQELIKQFEIYNDFNLIPKHWRKIDKKAERKKKLEIYSYEDANKYLENNNDIGYKIQKKLFEAPCNQYICKKESGFTGIVRLNEYLYYKPLNPKKKCFHKIENTLTEKEWYRWIKTKSKKLIKAWKWEFAEYGTVENALQICSKYLENTGIASKMNGFIVAIKNWDKYELEQDGKEKKKKKKKKNKDKQKDELMDIDKLNESKNKKRKKKDKKKNNESFDKMNECKIRKLQELDGFIDYGIIKEPAMKKRKLNHNNNDNIHITKRIYQRMNDIEYCSNCKQRLPENDRYRCSECKNAWYCHRKCQLKHWKIHESECILVYFDEATMNMNKEDDLIKMEIDNVNEWNWYSIIYWLNRVKNGIFNNMKYLNLRKHIFIGKINGYKLCKINDVTLNMIGIHHYNDHQMILNMIADLMMNNNNNNYKNDMVNMIKTDVVIPTNYIDPICYELMSDPVIIKQSGNCYERKLIQQYIKEYNKDPFNQKNVKLTDIISNHSLKIEIDAWKRKNLRNK